MQLFDVNSELYFNEKLNLWLSTLATTPNDVRRVLRSCFGIDCSEANTSARIYPWDQADPALASYGRFDQKIDFGLEHCVILELKVGTEATIGQLEKYLKYIPAAGYSKGHVVLLSRNIDAAYKLGYDRLKDSYPNLSFVTWGALESSIKSLMAAKKLDSPSSATTNFIELISFLTDISKRSQRLIDAPAPSSSNAVNYLATLRSAEKPKKKDVLGPWTSRVEFWNQVLADIVQQTGSGSFCAFRFDLYEWMIRWAYHSKHLFIDIYEDKNYEYYYDYFFSTVYPGGKTFTRIQLADMYYRMLLIRDDKEYLETEHHNIYFRSFGKRSYFYAIQKMNSATSSVPYVKLFEHRFPGDITRSGK